MSHAYLALKISWELFAKAPEALSDSERQRLQAVAQRQDAIERRILSTREASAILIPDETVTQRFLEIRNRYPSSAEFEGDLAAIDLDAATLREAIARDLRVESVLERVAAEVPALSVVDAEIYYRLHPEAFNRPEARRLRHILMTFSSAQEKSRIHDQLTRQRETLKTSEDFAQAALRHSQCPTALDGGQLGVVKRQQLYPELEPAAFALNPHEISLPVESPIGLHLIRCDEILPSGPRPFDEVRDRIIEKLTDKRRRDAQMAWANRLVV